MLSPLTPRSEESTALAVPLGGCGAVEADLLLPPSPAGVAVLVHGSGSNRRSPRNRHLARLFRELGFATLLLDLLTLEEQAEQAETGDPEIPAIELAERIITAAEWLRHQPDTFGIPVGYLGAGSGAGCALAATATRPDIVQAVVTLSGRTELADAYLDRVLAPTLLIVGSRDLAVVHRNRDALDRIAANHKHLEIVPGASHLFEEPGALCAVAIHAANWFARHLAGVDFAVIGHAATP